MTNGGAKKQCASSAQLPGVPLQSPSLEQVPPPSVPGLPSMQCFPGPAPRVQLAGPAPSLGPRIALLPRRPTTLTTVWFPVGMRRPGRAAAPPPAYRQFVPSVARVCPAASTTVPTDGADAGGTKAGPPQEVDPGTISSGTLRSGGSWSIGSVHWTGGRVELVLVEVDEDVDGETSVVRVGDGHLLASIAVQLDTHSRKAPAAELPGQVAPPKSSPASQPS